MNYVLRARRKHHLLTLLCTVVIQRNEFNKIFMLIENEILKRKKNETNRLYRKQNSVVLPVETA